MDSAVVSPRRNMELRNRVRKPINNVLLPELEDIINQELWESQNSSFLQFSLPMRFQTKEKRVEIEKQLKKLRERLSKTSTKLSKGNMNDSDADIIDFMNTLAMRVNLEVWEKSDGSLDMVERVCADVHAGEITFKSWQKRLDDATLVAEATLSMPRTQQTNKSVACESGRTQQHTNKWVAATYPTFPDSPSVRSNAFPFSTSFPTFPDSPSVKSNAFPSSTSCEELVDSSEELVEKVFYTVVVPVVLLTVALLSSVYQYLLGHVLKGGTKTYSSGSLDFRDTFVSLLLFRGSYVWIFFRDVAPRKVYRRSKKDEAGRVLCYYGKFEPRFKPPREKLPGGTSIKFDHLPLGGYDSERDATIVCQIAGFYYVKDEGRIQLRDGSFFTIPAVPEQEESLCGKEKAQWVAARAKQVFRDFQLMNNAIILPSERNTVGVHDYFQHVVSEEFSLDALLDAADAHPVDLDFVDSFCAVGEGLEGTAASPSSADLNLVDSFIAVGEGSEGTLASPSDAEQVVLRMERPQSLHLETSDAGSIAKLEIITQQLKEQLEAERNRRISENEQHLQREKQFEERISELERNSKLQLEDECM